MTRSGIKKISFSIYYEKTANRLYFRGVGQKKALCKGPWGI